MGIPGLLKFFRRNFPSAVTRVDLTMTRRRRPTSQKEDHQKHRRPFEQYDHLLVDMNNILHQHIRKRAFQPRLGEQGLSHRVGGADYERAVAASFNMDYFLRGFVYRDVNTLLQEFCPQKAVFLAMDGTGPLAKLRQQRKSRLKTNAELVNKLRITPGTCFMRDLRQRIQNEYVPYRKKPAPAIEMRLSGSDEPGEGELKMFHYVKELEELVSERSGQGRYLISSSDTDMMVFNWISPLRERIDLHFRGATPMDGELVHSDIMMEYFAQMAGSDAERAAIDLGLLTLLVGNDYLPRISHQMIEHSWRRYQDARTKDPKRFILVSERTDCGTIQVVDLNIEMMLDCLAEGNRRDLDPNAPVMSPGPKFSLKLHEHLQRHGGVSALDRENAIEVLSQYRADSTPAMVISFMKCVLWNVDMYLNAQINDYRMMYPYSVAPTKAQIRDVYYALGHDRFVEAIQPSKKRSDPLDEDVFCVAVMPPAGRIFVPEHLRSLFDEQITMWQDTDKEIIEPDELDDMTKRVEELTHLLHGKNPIEANKNAQTNSSV